MTKIVGFDTESYYDNEISVKPLGAWKYARHPRCDAYMISVCSEDGSWAGEPRHFDFSSLNGCILTSHNAAHDMEIYAANVEKGLWPKIEYADWHCTANMSSYLCNRRSLADASEFLLGVTPSKAMRNYMKGRTWAEAIADGKSEDLLEYARVDATLCHRLWVEHSHKWPEWERRLSKLTIEQGRRGVHIHRDRLEAAVELMQRVILNATDLLPWMQRGDKKAKATSRPRIVEECRRLSIPPPPIKAHDPEDYKDWEIEWSPKLPWVKALKDLRKAKKCLATLETMKLRLRDDGTMAFALKYFGAHTGRWSGDGGINFQNFAREPLFVQPESLSLVDDQSAIDSLMEGFSENPDGCPLPNVDMRGLLLPPPGKLMAAVDSAQIEPRVENYLVGNTALLDKIRAGFPIYEAHARDSMGWTGGKLKLEDPSKYRLAKARVLGLGYGCGWEKFILVAKVLANLDITVDDEAVARQEALDGQIYGFESTYSAEDDSWTFHEDKPCEPYYFIHNPRRARMGVKYVPQSKLPVRGANSRRIVADFRASNPLIVTFWRQMQAALERAASVGEDLVVELPSGRKLVYRKVQFEIRTVKDKETGLPEKRTVLTAEADGVRRLYYGALIVENITQAVARDVFAHNTLLAVDAGIDVMWTVHDEDVDAISSPEEGELARKLMTTVPEWLKGCPLDAELVISDRYKK